MTGQHLTREARDTLFLLAVLAWTLAPQWLRVPGWCAALSIAALAWRALVAWRGRALPSRWVLAGALALAVGLSVWQYRSVLGKEAGVTLLVALTALKTLELRARRDAIVVFFLGFLGVLTNFLYSQSLALALAMLLAVWGLFTALALAHRPAGRPALREASTQVLRSALWGAPLVAALFVFFPRLPPLWGVPADAGGRTGLSDSLELGQVAELASDDRIVLRVRFNGPAPQTDALYFRGPVLRMYDGRRWLADDGGLGQRPPADEHAPVGPPIHLQLDQPLTYEMTIEPLQLATLPLLELTAARPVFDGTDPPVLALRNDLHWQPRRPLTDRWRLTATAYLDATYHPGQVELVRPWDTLLPTDTHPRTVAWARALANQPALRQAPPATLATAVLAHIRSAGFSYTLAPGIDVGDAIDAFWLDRQSGFCEHFASAFVVVMRAMGVPARIVTGYQGGQVNPVDGLLEVRQSDAHAWAEYFSLERGWVRVDPTAAVAPERIQLSRRLAPPRGAVASALGQMNPTLLLQLRDAWSALDNRWNQWVLNYTRNRQFELLRELGWQTPDALELARTLFVAIGAIGLTGALWAAWDARRGRPRRDAWLRRYQRLQRQLRQRGLSVPEHLPPLALAQAARQRWGTQAEALVRLLADMEAERYANTGHTAPPRNARAWQQALAALRPLS